MSHLFAQPTDIVTPAFLAATRRHPTVALPATHEGPRLPSTVAWGRGETDACERGTRGCSVDHDTTHALTGRDGDCEGW